MRYTAVGQPIRQRQQVPRHRAEGPQVRLELAWATDDTHRRDDRFLVQVQSCHPCVNDVHDTPFRVVQRLRSAERGDNLPRVLPDLRGRQFWFRVGTQARLPGGLEAPMGKRPATKPLRSFHSMTTSRQIFIVSVAAKRHQRLPGNSPRLVSDPPKGG